MPASHRTAVSQRASWILGACIAVAQSASAATNVSIPDANLRATVEVELGKAPGGTISDEEMATLDRLDARGAGVVDLTGLEHATGLMWLDLRENKIASVASLSRLSALTWLSLGRNRIADISPLAGLTGLTWLSLGTNRIEDLSPLAGLVAVRRLYLGDNRIADLAPLAGLVSLHRLYLARNRITDIAPLVANTGLDDGDRVDLRGNPLHEDAGRAGILSLTERGVSVLSDLPAAVRIPDDNLRAVLERALGKTPGEVITEDEMATLTHLNASHAGIVDLTGLDYATGLASLSLSGNEIVDAEPLASLSALRSLSLDSNRIAEVSPLHGLTRLKSLAISANQVSDVSSLVGLSELEVLWLGNNPISDISPLSSLTALTGLYVGWSEVTDVSPLSNLRALTWLEMSRNRIADLSPLSDLTELTYLSLRSNRVSDISPLSKLTKLADLDLDYNERLLRDLSPLSHLTKLTTLNLRRSLAAGTDLSPLSSLTGLTRLMLSGSEIEDVSPLSRLTSLETLDLACNQIADLSPLAGLTKLTALDLALNAWEMAGLAGWYPCGQDTGNNISDVAPLAELSSLTRLYLGGNAISDISALAGLTRLTSLRLSDNDIADIAPLAELVHVRELHLANNRIGDIAPLTSLTQLRDLRLGGNTIEDIQPLTGLVRLRTLHLANNRIADISPLVANVGIASGDDVDLSGNPLNDESVLQHVPALQARGVALTYTVPVHLPGSRFAYIYDDIVLVMHVEEDVGDKTVYDDGLPLAEYATDLLAHFDDAFDYLLFFSNLDSISEHSSSPYYGIYLSVMNDTEGIGVSEFYDNSYGSAGKLRGVIHFPYNRALADGPSLHELQHAWSNYVIPTAVGAHWGFSSADGQLGGFKTRNLVELGAGRYAAGRFGTFANGGNRPAYSPIELYFAGFLPAEEVPDLWVAADGEWLVEGDEFVYTDDGQPIFTASDVQTYTVGDIIETHGARLPPMHEAQWHHRAAAVLLTDDAHPATAAQLERLSEHATNFSMPRNDAYTGTHNYYEATRGRGSITFAGLSALRKSTAAAPNNLPASFGETPPMYMTMRNGRCLAIARQPGGAETPLAP